MRQSAPAAQTAEAPTIVKVKHASGHGGRCREFTSRGENPLPHLVLGAHVADWH
jgi:hypothetical protein